MAKYYSAELSQKVSRGMNESRQKGQFTGGLIIYGYKVKDKKSPDNNCPDFSFCKEELKINLNPYRLKQENLEFIINIETFI